MKRFALISLALFTLAQATTVTVPILKGSVQLTKVQLPDYGQSEFQIKQQDRYWFVGIRQSYGLPHKPIYSICSMIPTTQPSGVSSGPDAWDETTAESGNSWRYDDTIADLGDTVNRVRVIPVGIDSVAIVVSHGDSISVYKRSNIRDFSRPMYSA